MIQKFRFSYTKALAVAACVAVVANVVLFSIMALLQSGSKERRPHRTIRTFSVNVVKKSVPEPFVYKKQRKSSEEFQKPAEKLRVKRSSKPVEDTREVRVSVNAFETELPEMDLQPVSSLDMSRFKIQSSAKELQKGSEDSREGKETGSSETGTLFTGPYGLDEVDQNPVRTAYVEPEYPPSARRLGLSGWVQCEFVVTKEGRVKGAKVVDSTGAESFQRSALRAVERWRFRPARVEGRPVPVRCRVRITFELREEN